MESSSNCHQQTCSYCGSGEVHRTVWNGFMERSVLHLLRIYPFRCRRCYKRFYGSIVSQVRANP